MPNKNSNAGHIPIRTCVICKKKTVIKQLLSFFILDKEIVFDINRLVPVRKKYICHEAECISALNKWLNNKNRKSEILKKGMK